MDSSIFGLVFLLLFLLFFPVILYILCHYDSFIWRESPIECKVEEFLFEQYAMFMAPFHFKPKKCKVIGVENCSIWNCKYHYNNNKYDVCQKGVDDEIFD